MPRHCSRPVAVLIALAVALLPSDLWAVVSFTFLAEERGPEPGTTLAGVIDVFVVGDYAYVANSERWSLAVLDISNPNDPIFVAEELGPSWDSFFGAGDVFVQGSYAYVAVGGDGASLAVIDISNRRPASRSSRGSDPST